MGICIHIYIYIYTYIYIYMRMTTYLYKRVDWKCVLPLWPERFYYSKAWAYLRSPTGPSSIHRQGAGAFIESEVVLLLQISLVRIVSGA